MIIVNVDIKFTEAEKQLIKNKDELTLEQIQEIILSVNPNDKEKILEILKCCMDRDSMLNGTSMENATTDRDALVRTLIFDTNVLDMPLDNKSFLIEIFDKLGLHGFENIETDLFSKQALEVLGKEDLYDLIKYYKVPGNYVRLGCVLENSEAFNKYQEFRQNNNVFTEKQMRVMDTYDSIGEFNEDSELITDCMTGELSEEQKKLLISYLREQLPKTPLTGRQLEIAQMTSEEAKAYLIGEIRDSLFNGHTFGEIKSLTHLREFRTKIEQMSPEEAVSYMLTGIFNEKIDTAIKTKEDLTKFPELRKEKIAHMIDKGDKDAVTILLAGMTIDEYQNKMRFLNAKQLDNAIDDFGEENTEFQKIQAANKLIELLLAMDEEKRKEVLHSVNADLALEFSKEGSIFANMRQAFEGAEISLRKLYGHELQAQLSNCELPQSVIDEEKGVDIIKLEGQDFKLVIHGIDVFSSGTGKYENREVGAAYLSASLISEKAIKYIGSVNSPNTARGCFYGFKNIGGNALFGNSDGDMGTRAKGGANSLEFQSTRPVVMTKTEQLLEDTATNKSAKENSDTYLADHNEVALFREYIDDNGQKQILTPEFIVSFSSRGGITEHDVEEAKRLGIPIIFIDEEKYKERTRKEVEHEQIEQHQDNGVNEEPAVHDKLPQTAIKARDVLSSTLGKIADSVPALKEDEAFKTIVSEINKTNEQTKEASAYEH